MRGGVAGLRARVIVFKKGTVMPGLVEQMLRVCRVVNHPGVGHGWIEAVAVVHVAAGLLRQSLLAFDHFALKSIIIMQGVKKRLTLFIFNYN